MRVAQIYPRETSDAERVAERLLELVEKHRQGKPDDGDGGPDDGGSGVPVPTG